MIKLLLKIFFVIATIIFSLTFFACKEEKVTLEKVQSTLDTVEHKLCWLKFRIAQEQWISYTGGRTDSLTFFNNLYNYVFSDMKTFNILTRGGNLLKQEEDIRRLELLRHYFLVTIVESRTNITTLRDTLQELEKDFEPEFMNEKKTLKEVRDVLSNDKSRTHREMAYRACHENGQQQANRLERLFRLRNQEARRAGYNNYLALLFSNEELKQNDIEKLLKVLDSLTLSSYRSILDKIRNSQGNSDIEIWDIPYYFSPVFSEFDSFFPADSQMRFLQAGLSEIGFSLNNLPLYFNLENIPGGSTDIHTLVIKSPFDQRIVGTLDDGHQSFKNLTHNIGKALYAANIAQVKLLYTYPADNPWTAGIEYIFTFLVEDKNWLEKFVSLTPDFIERYKTARQEWGIINLRLALVNLNFEFEAYKNPRRDLNKVYWDIFEKITRLPRHDDINAWATDMNFVNHPLALKNNLLAQMIAAQTLSYLNKNYVSMVDNPETKAFLVQNYFRFGSRYEWQEMIQRGTGEELNPRYFLTYLGL